MKKLLIIAVIALSSKLYAAPGDTTWVYANNVKLNYYNNFDTAVAFPSGSVSYRKILMFFTLGEYNCPSGSTYCHQWDYTVTNYLMTKTDTVELSRFITPYANTGVPRFPSSWKQVYTYDVTDFYPLMKDTATVRIYYSGYSGGFTGSIKFAFIEGTPERNVYGITPLWRGAFNYGDPSDPINNHVPVQSLTAPSNTNSAELKFTVTGHGSDSTSSCCEFDSNAYYVILNNDTIALKAIWREDCGFNELYPQGGTWIFNRGNWCPGDAVNTNTHILTGVTAGSNYSLDVNFSPYSNAPYQDYGDYFLEGHVVYYGNCNHTLDASLEDIISPNNFADHFRENPSGNSPVVKVRNSGSSTINSITFSYGVKDSAAVQYTWTGTLVSLHDTDIALNPLPTLTNMSLAGLNGVCNFIVKILTVNGTADQDSTNNVLQSTFVVAPTWPNKFLVTLKTNNEINFDEPGTGSDPSETSWQITDMNNNILFSKLNASVSTTYKDTISLPVNGFYKLTINNIGCDGLQWWLWTENTGYGITSGSFEVSKLGTGTAIPMNGYNYTGTFNNDFGCGFSQYFTTEESTVGIVTLKNNTSDILVYPNPAMDNITIENTSMDIKDEQISIYNIQGELLLRQPMLQAKTIINVSSLSNGVYVMEVKTENGVVVKKVVKE
jgi:hypothetical protein